MKSAAINARIDIISCDKLYQAAEDLSKKIPSLTNSQISGLKNIARCAPTAKEIEDYIKHQKDKTKAIGGIKRQEAEKYWEAIIKEIPSIAKIGKELSDEMGLDKKEKAELELALTREFVYHLSAVQMFRLKK